MVNPEIPARRNEIAAGIHHVTIVLSCRYMAPPYVAMPRNINIPAITALLKFFAENLLIFLS
jgi:hypothetical protein